MSEAPKKSIRTILAELREYNEQHDRTQKAKGDLFERLIRAYLLTDPQYSVQFSDVWLWSEWEYRGGADTGIDLVAKYADGSGYCAVQCKFYDEHVTLNKSGVDSFISESGKTFTTPEGDQNFVGRIFVFTGKDWGKNAKDAIIGQNPPIEKINIEDLEASPVDWAKFSIAKPDNLALKPQKKLRDHQKAALAAVENGLAEADRGKLIMACGTGKTFTALKIAEKLTPKKGTVLFLVPSLFLMGQTLREWTAESARPIHAFAVCSDDKVAKSNKRKAKPDEDIYAEDLAIAVTTNPKKLTEKYGQTMRHDTYNDSMTVVFSTYQSINTISKAQLEHQFPDFDLIICDEAHRTTGIEEPDKPKSEFVLVHDAALIRGKKRLYMTATPRLYSETSKSKAKENDIVVWSMDDENVYGKELYRLGFGRAVELGLLTDYKVLVLGVNEAVIGEKFMKEISDADNELTLDDAILTVGCWNGLSKIVSAADEEMIKNDPEPMRRAVAFTNTINNSKRFRDLFTGIIDLYKFADPDHLDDRPFLDCHVEHVDGSFDASDRNQLLEWLKADTSKDGNICHVLTNARCLSEGVDVPSLDAVMFLSARNSTIDIVQSVGRVMRKDPTGKKKFGYIILPVGIPADVDPAEALKDNKRYKIIWDVLQALRAHDDRFNSTINKIELNKAQPENIKFIGVGFGGEDQTGEGGGGSDVGDTEHVPGTKKPSPLEPMQRELFDELDWRDALYARMVVKCGERDYWDRWAGDVAKIAQRHADRIRQLNDDPKNREIFDRFVKDLRGILNPSISEDDAIEMLCQHLITKPVFDALFENYEFTKHNPISKAMQGMLDLMEGQALDKETASLDKFYDSVKMRVSKIDNLEGKQKILTRLYDEFFRTAFTKMTVRLGIVYTPIEVVDFIIRSADHALRHEFGVGIADKGVNVIDPFTGTGTFIVRLLQSGLFPDAETIRYKYENELHANDIVLLAYYLAAINIEETYHSVTKDEYLPFKGIVLTDTFQLAERQSELIAETFTENAGRIKRQKAADIQLIIGNPPYSVGQDSANDNNQNLKYDELDRRIAGTYALLSTATNKNSLYDSYIRAFRWASDRIGDKGIVCFVTNGGYIDGNAMDGFRKSLVDEFQAIYCFNLRGNARTSGERRRREKDNVFGQGTRTPVAIMMLVKNPEKKSEGCTLYYHDIGDYLTREQKLNAIKEFGSSANIDWQIIEPNESGDWIEQRSEEFMDYPSMGDKKNPMEEMLFTLYSRGLSSGRDAWVYGFSRKSLIQSMQSMIDFYNAQVKKYDGLSSIDDVIDYSTQRISWTRGLKNDFSKRKTHPFEEAGIMVGHYRPFCKQWAYFDKNFNDMTYQMPKVFCRRQLHNIAICVNGIGVTKPFSSFIVNTLPDVQLMPNGQCFPLYTYEHVKPENVGKSLFSDDSDYVRHDNISDQMHDKFRALYEDDSIGKEDIFYYVYGVLHSPTYREDYADDLKKMLPRIPFVKDFWGYSKAGRELAHWHLNYETVEPYPLEEVGDKTTYHVEKMRFGKIDGKDDKSVIVYNSHLKFNGIPLEAYEYVVNGKSALEWIMERYAITTDKASGIKNDPNEWAKECGDERYIADLVKRIVRVSLETVRIVSELPPLEIIEDNTEVKTITVEPPKQNEKKEHASLSRTMRPDREYVQREIRLAPLNDDEMRALSVKQPWAALIANGRKTVEHRTWQTDYRGELLICASGTPDRDAINHVGLPAHTQLPLGAAVCVVDLIDCRLFTREDTEAACMGEYAKGYAWVLSNPRPIEPFPVKGQLHIFTVKLPHEIADKLKG